MINIEYPLTLEATQGSYFREQVTSRNPLETTITVEGGLPPGLTAISLGRLTISGTPVCQGTYKVRVVEKRTRTITIHVGPAAGMRSRLSRNWQPEGHERRRVR
jgi:hypothetical protein